MSILFAQRHMTKWREKAKRAALYAADHIPNSPASGDLRRAAQGLDEELLLGVAIIVQRARNEEFE